MHYRLFSSETIILFLVQSDRGTFLVEFAKPPVSHGRHPVQKTGKDDIVEYVNGMKHSLLPGDKVLAPWEPDMARYGPGTVLTGIETRDPLRGKKDAALFFFTLIGNISEIVRINSWGGATAREILCTDYSSVLLKACRS